MSGADVHPSLAESTSTLTSYARKTTGNIPPEVLVAQVTKVTADADWPVRKAALDALLRRLGFAKRDGLVVSKRPKPGRVLGTYVTGRGESVARGEVEPRRGHGGHGRARPYQTVLESLEPLRASCDCADYLRGSLGLCKHLLVVLDHVFESPERKARALREQDCGSTNGVPRLSWDPVRPLTGPGERLLGLSLELSGRAPSAHGRRPRWAHWFHSGRLAIDEISDPKQRLALTEELAEAIEAGALVAAPAVQALLREERDRARRLLEAGRDARPALSVLKSLGRKLYPYQHEGVRRALESGHLLLADDMGLGKTTQAIAVCHALYQSRKVARGLLIVPASLKPQWLREWQETTQVPVQVVDGSPTERVRQYRQMQRGFLIINYEQLLRDLQEIHRFGPEIVILDEAQRIKNWATKSSAYVKTLRPRYRLVLTGTPMENRLEELASILDWVDDTALAPKWRLVPWHTQWDGDGATAKVGARHLDTLRTRLQGCVLRRVRKEVLAQLPSRTDTRVPVLMTSQQAEEHAGLDQPIASLMSRAKRRPLTQAEFLKLMQLLTTQRIICNGLAQLEFDAFWPACSRSRPDPALLEGLFSPKLVELRRLLGELVLEQQRKVVIFSQWRRMLRLADWSVSDLLKDKGYRSVFFTGAEKQVQRTRSVVDFHDDPEVRVMFLSDAGGVGLNLQRAANVCINLELPWNPAVLEQRVGRIHRLGQTQPIDVYNLVSESGLESRIAATLVSKQALFSGLFDGTTDEIKFDLAGGFLSEVERLIEPVEVPAIAVNGAGADADSDPEGDPSTLAENESALPVGTETTCFAPGEAAPAAASWAAATSLEGEAAAGDAPSAQTATALAAPDAFVSAFAALRAQRTADGGLRIEAPPEAAATLLAMLDGLSKILRASIGQTPLDSAGARSAE
jgi:superfamily II DNA or RNA helicase